MCKKIYNRLVSEMDSSFLFKKVEAGEKPDHMINEINDFFDEFFINKEMLRRHSSSYLIMDWINFNKDENNYDRVELLDILSILNSAKSTDCESILRGVAEFQDITGEIGNKHWSMCILERDLSELGDYEFVSEAFTSLENITEVILKNYLAVILFAFRIVKGKNTSLETVLNLKFGNVVNELGNCKEISDLLVINNISISQWRNIAAHKSYQFENSKILCRYGTKLDKSVVISKDELIEVVKRSNTISQLCNFAFKFFTYDNLYEINEYYKHVETDVTTRDETWHLLFVTELYIHGFRVKEIEQSENNLKISVHDMTSDDVRSRSMISSLFIYKAWVLSMCESIEMNYYTKENIKFMRSTATSDICKQIAYEGKSITDIFKLADYEKY